MDEPFGALDAQTRGQMQMYLKQIWMNVDVTILFITHDLDEAVLMADRIIVLKANPGRVAEIIEVPLLPSSWEAGRAVFPALIATRARHRAELDSSQGRSCSRKAPGQADDAAGRRSAVRPTSPTRQRGVDNEIPRLAARWAGKSSSFPRRPDRVQRAEAVEVNASAGNSPATPGTDRTACSPRPSRRSAPP